MPARLSAFLVWALVAASAMFWGLRLFVSAPTAPAHTLLVADSGPERVDLTRMLGAAVVATVAAAPTPAIASRFQLSGVMAPKEPGDHGIALIAVDGKMPRAYRVGTAIDSELVLQSVSRRSATIGPAGAAPAVVLELPALPPPTTGNLPPLPAFGAEVGDPAPPIVNAPESEAPPATMALPQITAPQGRPIVPRPKRDMGTTPRDMSQSSAATQ